MSTEATSGFRDFNGDYDALVPMIARSWAGNRQGVLYDRPFIESAFRYPGNSWSMAPTYYVDGVPAGFASAHPRHVEYQGHRLTLPVSAMLSVASELQGRLGGVLLRELIGRVRSGGSDGLIMYCIAGDPMDRMLVPMCRALRITAPHVFRVEYLVKMILAKRSAENTEDQPERAVSALVELGNSLSATFARRWTEDEARWQCLERANAVYSLLERGGRRGMLTGYVQRSLESQASFLMLDDILWGDLEAAERDELLAELYGKAIGGGANMVVVPRLRYFDEQPFANKGFKPTAKAVNVYIANWRGIEMGEAASYYMDVF